MSVLRALRLLILGETWELPAGVGVTLAACVVLRHVAPHAWHDAGGFVLLGGVIVVLTGALAR
jgi:hypothetical protein